MLTRVEEFVRMLQGPLPARLVPKKYTGWLVLATDEEVAALLDWLRDAQLPEEGTPAAAVVDSALAQLARRAAQPTETGGHRRLTDEQREQVAALYELLGPANKSRHHLLCLLTYSRQEDDLHGLTQLLVDDPPSEADAAALALAPLFQHDDYDVAAVFPRLLDAVGNSNVAPVVLDLANFVTREGLVAEHPARDRATQMAALLGSIVERLGQLEGRPVAANESGEQLAQVVSEGVALAVSLSDSLGLCGEPAVIGKLNQALQLGHRRLRTEAAAALVRLGDKSGEQVLVELAAEPVARLRVLAYASELNLLEKIDEQHRTPQAQAEAELVSWLSEPTQFGLPPQECELFDSVQQYWPGFDEPVDCFLFRYTYRLGGMSFSNIGIAGPLAHTFRADLANLPPADIYAAFAGWQAEHEEVFELDYDRLNELERIEASRLERRLHDAGFDNIRPLTLGYFFGDRALVAHALHNGKPGIAVADVTSESFYPTTASHRPLGPAEAYCIYKGRKLLRTFNVGESSE